MPRAQREKRIGLDTNVLLDLGAAENAAHEFRETFQENDYQLLVPPTVIADLRWLRTHHGDATKQTHAGFALAEMMQP